MFRSGLDDTHTHTAPKHTQTLKRTSCNTHADNTAYPHTLTHTLLYLYRHRNEITQLEAGVHAIQTTPKFGIGQRCILVQARGGNVLWDCVSLVNDETIAAVEALG